MTAAAIRRNTDIASAAPARVAAATRRVVPGGYVVTGEEEVLVTVLGSCVSACVRDSTAGVGGMNHFMLPENGGGGGDRWLDPHVGLATRYGSFAMERLINDLLTRGARRERLEIKLFGGARILAGAADVGQRNIEFIRDFVQQEGLRIAAEDLGGNMPRMLSYLPQSGRARVKHLQPLEARIIAEHERAYLHRIGTEDQTGEVELFE